MLDSVMIKSPAKLNLHLKVYPKRADGYHDIESLFQAIDFFDELLITKTEQNGICDIAVTSINLPLENTLTVAYREFCSYTGTTEGVHIELTKRIYSGAGLGGGSSNAAALIEGLNILYKTGLSQQEKANIALNVGSDVPFFLYGGAAIVTGRGEHVQQITMRSDLFFVVIMPDVHSSTKLAFECFDEQNNDGTPRFINLAEVEDVYQKPVANWSFNNSFTDLLVNKHPSIGKAIKSLESCGAEYSQMSGSGASVFGVFGDEERAKIAYTTLSVEWSCQLARSYSINPC